MKHIKLFEAFGSFMTKKEKKIDVKKTDDIEYTVRYEKEVDGEHENDTKTFYGLEQLDNAIKFAKEKYSSIDFELDVDGKIRNGFVSPEKKEHYIFESIK